MSSTPQRMKAAAAEEGGSPPEEEATAAKEEEETAAEARGILRSMPLCSAAAACRLQKSEIHFVRGAFR